MSEAKAPKGSKPRYKRSAKNYLIDRHFQLKYTGFLVGIALFLSIALGSVLVLTSQEVIEQTQKNLLASQQQVELGKQTVERGQEVIEQSRKVSQVVSMNIAKEYADDPELAKTFGEAAAQDEKKLAVEQERLESDAQYLRQRAMEIGWEVDRIAKQQTDLLTTIVVLLALLVLSIGFAGIVFTHKIAGPIFKMKRLLREVGEGKLVVKERLRKGDELHHFFETFEKMVEDLRQKQKDEIAQVDSILEELDKQAKSAKGDSKGVSMLRELREEMQDHLEA
jgi:hypothetical protein